jgi:hypothetical protein
VREAMAQLRSGEKVGRRSVDDLPQRRGEWCMARKDAVHCTYRHGGARYTRVTGRGSAPWVTGGGARHHGAGVVLRWLLWLNGVGWPRLMARAEVCSVRRSMAQDSTTERARRAE